MPQLLLPLLALGDHRLSEQILCMLSTHLEPTKALLHHAPRVVLLGSRASIALHRAASRVVLAIGEAAERCPAPTC